jgi:SAM-dependent methyltransferase
MMNGTKSAYLLGRLGVSAQSRVLCVGIGCGLEGVGIYDTFAEFVGTDISEEAVRRAQKVFASGNCRVLEASAEDLGRDLVNFDAYISLKTFSSSFFDIPKAIIQTSRTLKSGGVAVISVPRGYSKRGVFVPGLARTTYNLESAKDIGTYAAADKSYPLDLMKEVSLNLYRRQFHDITYFTGLTEHYVMARKK